MIGKRTNRVYPEKSGILVNKQKKLDLIEQSKTDEESYILTESIQPDRLITSDHSESTQMSPD